jgi:hypothetical protein
MVIVYGEAVAETSFIGVHGTMGRYLQPGKRLFILLIFAML